MNTFNNVVVAIAVVILILTLIVIGVLLHNAIQNMKFPPEVGSCPDYFTMKEQDGSNVCFNKTPPLGEGGAACLSKDFSGAEYQGDKGRAAKCKWAKSCNVVWDGITNQNLC